MDIQLPQILFQIINFGVVMGAITFLMYKPIQKVLDERASKIAEGQAAAEAVLTEKRNLDIAKLKIEREAEKKAAMVVEDAAKKATATKREMIEKARVETQAEIEKMKVQWQAEKQQLVLEMRQEMIETVMAVSAKILGAKLDAKTDAKLIATELDKLTK